MRMLVVVALLAGCKQGSNEQFPINPGGGGGPSGMGMPDAAIGGDGGDGGVLTGRVCVISDARQPLSCAASGQAGLSVTLGTAMTLTADDGSFTLPAATGTNLVWHVSGSGIEPSAMQLGTTAVIPAIDALVYADMLSALSVVVVDGDGALIARITRSGSAVAGATVASTAAEQMVYYDGASITAWESAATGAFGVVWMPNVRPGSVELTVDDGTPHSFTGIPVVAGAITFAFVELP